ncbi:MAG: hypothetical protein ISR64_00610 [Deltaproteobacteria bacterium]|nr:hypothetical protein [Deltaproteobacteria bacterium]
MKSLLKFVLACVFVVGMAVGDAYAQDHVPSQLNVQGVLRNVAGEVVTGNYGMTFRLFDASSGGSLLFTQIKTASVVGGVFNVYLGPVSPTVFVDKSQVYLEIQIGTDVLPRRAITSVGFAFQAEHAEQCDELLGAATDVDCANPSGCIDLADLAVNYASSATKGGPADDLVCNGCVANTDVATTTITGAQNLTGVGNIAGSTIGSWNLYNGAVTTDKIANDAVDSNKLKDDPTGAAGAVGTHHIQNNAVTAAKIADGNVGNADINFNYADSDSKGGAALNLTCSSQCVSSGEVDFNYAASNSKGGPATNVECPNFGGAGVGCVGTGDVAFNYAGSASKGGAASDLACSGCVVEGEIHGSVYYAAGTAKGGDATGLQCSGCVGNSDIDFNYAASASQGGDATGLTCTGCVGNAELQNNYAGSSSKGGPAVDVNCPGGCVDTADINNMQVTNVKIAGPISGSKIDKATASAVGVAKFGSGLSVDGNALVTVDYTQVSPAAHDHGALYFKKGTEDLYLNAGFKFHLYDGGSQDYAYFRNHTTASDEQIAFQLVLGNEYDQSERFEIYTEAPGNTGVTHALYANGKAYHKGDLEFLGELTTKAGGGIDSADIKDGAVSSADIANGTIAGGDLASNISFTTSGDITADEVIANRFVDRGNTARDADPNGTSDMNVIRYYGSVRSGGSNSYGLYGNNAYFDTINTGAAGDPLEINHYRCGPVRVFTGGCGGNTMTVYGNLDARVFRDADNPGYYVNPASTSNINRLQLSDPLYFMQSNEGIRWNGNDMNLTPSGNNLNLRKNSSTNPNLSVQGWSQSLTYMTAPLYYDGNDHTYYVDPAGNSRMGSSIYLSKNANVVLGQFAPWLGGGSKGISMYQYNYMYPGRVNGGGWNTSWYLGSHSSYGLWTNTGFYTSGSVWGDRFYDRNNTGCYWDGTDGSGSQTGRLGVYDAYVHGHFHANYGRVDGLRLHGSDFYQATSWMNSGHIIPHSNNGYWMGYHWNREYRVWHRMESYGFITISSEKFKKDIQDLDAKDDEWVLSSLRQVRSAKFYMNEEIRDRASAQAIAEEEVRGIEAKKRKEYEETSMSGEEIDKRIEVEVGGREREKHLELAVRKVYRTVPHIGVIAESLPDELGMATADGNGVDKHGYSLNDMDGLLMAGLKTLDRQIQQRDQRIEDLEDRIALIEQLLVDEGILK